MGKLAVSTDIDVFCHPDEIYEVYGHEFNAVEVIGWRWSEQFLRRAKDAGLPVWRLHGRIGRGSARINLLNQLLLPTAELMRLADKYQVRKVLLHVTEVRQNWKETIKLCRGVELAVENSDRNGSGLKTTFETAERLKKEGLECKVVGDVGHFGLEMGENFSYEQVMQKFLQLMTEYRKEFGVETGAHLPINKESDGGAVDMDEISDETLGQFVSSFEDLVVENQVNPFLKMTKEYADEFRLKSKQRWERIKRLTE